MKKLALLLTLALVLAFAAPVFANPFSDVPADHWAYDAIAKLQADGVVGGNPDGTFTGSKSITRYEMATIVAKAMAAAEKNADKITKEDEATIAKLSAEFNSELAALGVKVAALEKKVGNVKFTGDARLRYRDQEVKDTNGDVVTDQLGSRVSYGRADMRVRLTATATVNDKVEVVTRIRVDDYVLNSNQGSADVDADNFYVKYADKGLTAIAGRQDVALGKATIFDDTIKGAVVAAPVGNLTATVAYGYLDEAEVGLDPDRLTLTALQLDGIKLGDKVTLGLDYGIIKDKDDVMYATEDQVKVWGVNFDYALNNKVNLFGEYVKSDIDAASIAKVNDDAFLVGVGVKDVLKKTDLKVSYTELGAQSVVPGLYTNDGVYSNALEAAGAGVTTSDTKTKLWNVRLDHALMKNTNLYVDYYKAKTEVGDTDEGKVTRIDTGLEFKF